MTFTVASHQEAIKMLWLNFWEAVISSILDTSKSVYHQTNVSCTVLES